MPPDPGLIAETRAWLREAIVDLRAAEILVHVESELASRAAFHTQQAAEKCLKAFLTWNKKTFRKTHNLLELGRACVKLDSGFRPIAIELTTISGWAVETRYLGDWSRPTSDDGEGNNESARASCPRCVSPTQ